MTILGQFLRFFFILADVLLNVFLAIAVDNITLDDDDEAAEEEAAQAEQEHKEAIKEKYAPPPSARYNTPLLLKLYKKVEDRRFQRKVRKNNS